MATQTTGKDYASEKQDVHYVEHARDEPTDSSLELHKEKTMEGIDMHNSAAIKGDDSDGKIVWSIRSRSAAFFLAALYTGSQIILYFTGGSLGFISADLGLTRSGWLPTANILAIAATCPFAGYLQHLFGKRYIALFGSVCICIGCALVGSGKIYAQFLAGMSLSGVGAAIGELTGLSGLAEIVPVKYRGYSLAALSALVTPFAPYLIYVEMWSNYDTTGVRWRWGPWVALMFNGMVGIGLLVTYFPHNHTRAAGFSRMAILKRIDYLGGALSITGLTLFLVALQSGGYTHPWASAYVLCTMLIGLGLILAWIIYEWKFARYPMVPGELFKGQRIVGLAYVVAFAAGMNFFSIRKLSS